jgi:hypothetical protein
MMREGVIPVIAGTVATSIGSVIRGTEMMKSGMRKRDVMPMVSAGLVGFGIAHIVLGAIDLNQSRHKKGWSMFS